MQDFQISLKAARVNAKIEQQEAADKLGISVRALRNYEAERAPVPADLLEKAAEIYGTPAERISVLIR